MPEGAATATSEVYALLALEALLGGHQFWSPSVLKHADPADVEALVTLRAEDDPSGPWALQRAKELRELPAFERLWAISGVLRNTPVKCAAMRHALSWAAGLPYKPLLRGGNEKRIVNLNLRRTRLTWLPGGLHVPGRLDLRESAVKELPDDLSVGGELVLDPLITTVPNAKLEELACRVGRIVL
jgi:hypothetical protein